MKSYNHHAAENETPRQQLREDADACDMPPATFRSFPALSVPASSRSKRRSNGRESRAATPSCRPCGRREASGRRWCTSRASATCARVQDIRVLHEAPRQRRREGETRGKRNRCKKDAAREAVSARSRPRKVMQNGGIFSKCVNFRKKY